MSNLRFNKINIIFTFGLIIIVGIGVISYISKLKLDAYNKLVVHTDEVLAEAKSTLAVFIDIETGMRGYVITGNPTFLDPYNQGIKNIEERITNLQKLTMDNPKRQLSMGELTELKDMMVERCQALVDLRRSQGFAVAAKKIGGGEGKKIMDQVRAEIGNIESDERQLLADRVSDTNYYSKIMTWITIVGSALAIGLILFALIILNRQLKEIKENDLAVQRLNFQLTEKVVELETSNKELESFSYSVSHDLRAPLRTMIGFSSVILEDHGDTLVPGVKDSLGRVIAATKKMGQLIDGLLDLSRLSRKDMISENVNLSSLVDSILKDFKTNDPVRKVAFEVTKDIVVKGDTRLLQAALYNLLSNAWKFTRTRDEARIEFGFKKVNDQKTYFIGDNGVGFDMAYVNKIFGVFQRLHSSAEYEGTGIGLATVQRIILKHGGKIWVESEINKGTTFHFTI